MEFLSGLKYPGSMELYERTNQRVEAASKLIYSINTYIAVPGFVLPNAIFCYFRYFVIEDLGSEAFDLSLPLWYVFETHFMWRKMIWCQTINVIYILFSWIDFFAEGFRSIGKTQSDI